MSNKFCKHLNLEFDFNLSVVDQFKTSVSHSAKSFRLNEIDSNVYNFLNSLNIITAPPACFYTPPGADRGLPHVDSMELNNMVKLNYIIGGKNTVMQWFKFNGNNKNIIHQHNGLGSGYLKFDQSMCELIWEEEIKGPCLVNAGIPHNVKNRSDTDRWSISYTLFDLNNNHLQWSDAEQIFKNYFGP